jgi:hypothetical protein
MEADLWWQSTTCSDEVGDSQGTAHVIRVFTAHIGHWKIRINTRGTSYPIFFASFKWLLLLFLHTGSVTTLSHSYNLSIFLPVSLFSSCTFIITVCHSPRPSLISFLLIGFVCLPLSLSVITFLIIYFSLSLSATPDPCFPRTLSRLSTPNHSYPSCPRNVFKYSLKLYFK